MPTNATHDPSLRSWIDYAAESPFPIQNLPFGVFCPHHHTAGPDAPEAAGNEPRVGVAIGDHVLDLAALAAERLFRGPVVTNEIAATVFGKPTLNHFMTLGPAAWSEVRARLSQLLLKDNPELRDNTALRTRAMHELANVSMRMPVHVGDYTDFYASRDHATNVGTMFRGKENALMPNWLHLPVGYHGRASSIVVSGTPVRRPCGQTVTEDAGPPSYTPSKLLDFELEMAFFVGVPNKLGTAVPARQAQQHIFGFALCNDWSARDIQKWEYVPLGPFGAKNFATTISPWIVTAEALEPFRIAGPAQNDPVPLPYLKAGGNDWYDIHLEVALSNSSLKGPFVITRTNFKHMYWSASQQLAHHTVTGCNMHVGDMLASGTISGPEKTSRGCLLEYTWRGTEPIDLPDGTQRKFLQDGDIVIMTGWAQGDGYRIGFGACSGEVLPATPLQLT